MRNGHWMIGIALLLIAYGAMAQTAEPDNSRACREQSVAQHVAMLDTLRQAVLDYYPLELLDSSAWDQAIEAAKAKARSELDSAASYFRYVIEGLLPEFCPDEGAISRYERTCHEPDLEIKYELMPTTIITQREKNNLLSIRIASALNADIVEKLDAALDSVRDAGGLLLDLRGLGRISWENAVEIAKRFSDRKRDFLRAKVRVTGETESRDTLITIDPSGVSEFTRPLVVLADSGYSEAGRALVRYLNRRLYSEVLVENDIPRPHGILPARVTLPGGSIADIPTAMAVDENGERIGEFKANTQNQSYQERKRHDVNFPKGLKKLRQQVSSYEKQRRELRDKLRKRPMHDVRNAH